MWGFPFLPLFRHEGGELLSLWTFTNPMQAAAKEAPIGRGAYLRLAYIGLLLGWVLFGLPLGWVLFGLPLIFAL